VREADNLTTFACLNLLEPSGPHRPSYGTLLPFHGKQKCKFNRKDILAVRLRIIMNIYAKVTEKNGT
jgi:hypothetical protein